MIAGSAGGCTRSASRRHVDERARGSARGCMRSLREHRQPCAECAGLHSRGAGSAQGTHRRQRRRRRRPLAFEQRDHDRHDDVEHRPDAEVPAEGYRADGRGRGGGAQEVVAEVGVVEGEEDGDGGEVAEVHADGLAGGGVADVAPGEQGERPAVDCDVLRAVAVTMDEVRLGEVQWEE